MNKRTRAFVLLVAAVGVYSAMTSSASATLSRTTPCTNCHSGTNVPVSATPVSNNGTTATYSFSSPNATAISVFDGSTRVVTIAATTGQFTVNVGKTYTVYSVRGPSTNSGIGSTSVSPAAPVVDTTAPSTVSDAKATYVGSATIKLTATDNSGGSGVAATYYRIDGGVQTAGTTAVVTGVGAHTIEFWSVDKSGNTETPHKTANFTITAPPVVDTTAPSTVSDAKATYVGSATIKLTATDNSGGSGVAATYYRIDGGVQTAGTTAVVTGVGAHTIEFWSVDVAGNAEAPHKTANFTITAPPTEPPHHHSVVSCAGASRFDTAVETSKLAFPTGLPAGGTRTVVIATGRNWPDALGGTSLAGALGGPVLLVDRYGIPASVRAEIERLGATNAIILGGTGAVGTQVQDALESMLGDDNVERIAGGDRYATANAIALRVIELLGTGYDGTAFVATGANFPDALAAAPIAAANGWPLFLAAPGTGLSSSTRAAMSGVDRVVILGGTGVVGGATEAYCVGVYGAGNVERLAGADRYHTAAIIAAYGVSDAGLSWDGVAIATGSNFPDALAGGVLQGTQGSVMLLTQSTTLSTPARDALAANKTGISAITIFGGTGAVSTSVRSAVTTALQ